MRALELGFANAHLLKDVFPARMTVNVKIKQQSSQVQLILPRIMVTSKQQCSS